MDSVEDFIINFLNNSAIFDKIQLNMATQFKERALYKVLQSKIEPGKVVVLLGARRVGKTELIKRFLSEKAESSFLFLNGEDQSTIDVLAQKTAVNYARLIQDRKLLVIDEAQAVPEIGKKLKFIVDEFPHLKVIATGSSVFDLTQKMGEPLVGRQKLVRLYPLAQLELKKYENLIETNENLENRLIFGGYPELERIEDWQEKADYLEHIVSDYLLRDILAFNNIRKADKILDLLRLISLQIGKEVSIDELANSLKGISRNTIESYLDLLEKVFVIYKVNGFSRNMRKEVSKAKRWYFYDNGIRNAVIRNFSTLNLRMDKGELWENYMMAERIKFKSYTNLRPNRYFWRTYDQQEIDLIEEEKGRLHAFEFKFNNRKKPKAPAGWSKNYPEASYEVIHPKNYLDFIGA